MTRAIEIGDERNDPGDEQREQYIGKAGASTTRSSDATGGVAASARDQEEEQPDCARHLRVQRIEPSRGEVDGLVEGIDKGRGERRGHLLACSDGVRPQFALELRRFAFRGIEFGVVQAGGVEGEPRTDVTAQQIFDRRFVRRGEKRRADT